MLRGLPDLAKRKISKIVINQRLPNVQYSLFVFFKGRQFSFFYKSDNLKLISKFVSSDYSVFLCFYATQL